MVKVIEIAPTPNPDAQKFLVDSRLIQSGARSFDTPQSGQDDPLAKALFSLGEVNSVFYMDRFVTVSKSHDADWNVLKSKIITLIEKEAQPVQEAAPAAASSAGPASDDAVLEKINQVLNENVRPALAGDGGGLEVISYKDHVLSVHYQGACGSCPSSTSGTLFAIQNLLQRMVDPAIQVVPA